MGTLTKLLFSISIISSQIINCQVEYKGSVIDSLGVAIPRAIVKIQTTSSSSTVEYSYTNDYGFFKITTNKIVDSLDYQIKVDHLG